MSEILTNPTMTGLMGGAAVLGVQIVWNRVMGASTEMSFPAQFAEIRASLTAINLKLELILQDKERMKDEHKELKSDFWDHMETYHGAVK